MTDLFGHDAKAARDAALKRVAENGGNWRSKALCSLSLLENGWIATAEDIRIKLRMKGLEAPHHHNAWGELIKTAIKSGVLMPTGQFKHMRTDKSHARRTPVYLVRTTVTGARP